MSIFETNDIIEGKLKMPVVREKTLENAELFFIQQTLDCSLKCVVSFYNLRKGKNEQEIFEIDTIDLNVDSEF